MWFYVVILCIAAFYFWITSHYTFWKKNNVPNPPTNWFFGNVKDVFFIKKSFAQFYEQIYKMYPDFAYVGFYKMQTPFVLVRDPEIVKDIMVKEFQSFHDNNFELDKNDDPMFGRNPFIVRGDEWKKVRTLLVPGFANLKMKALFPIMQDISEKFVTFLEEQQKTLLQEGQNAKEICTKFTTENVISCMYGIEANCFKNDKADFREMGRKLLDTDMKTAIKFMIIFLLPSASRYLKVNVIPDSVAAYFRKVTKEVVQYRKENNIQRNDYLGSILEAQNKHNELDMEDVTAHCVGLFLDGVETSSIAISFILYELAANPLIQDKLKKEIDEVIASGDVTFDSIHNMPYLDAVMSESLRLHPPSAFIARKCTKPFKLPSADGTKPDSVEISVNTPVAISLIGLHMDKKYFSGPEVFNPERFLDENRESYPKYAYMPFGEGPRICIGMRFGVCQTKLAVFNIIKDLEVTVNKKTIEPLELDPSYFLMAAKGGLWLNFKRR